jgi:hypothetical protein
MLRLRGAFGFQSKIGLIGKEGAHAVTVDGIGLSRLQLGQDHGADILCRLCHRFIEGLLHPPPTTCKLQRTQEDGGMEQALPLIIHTG